MGGKWSAEALENFRKLRKNWKAGQKPFTKAQRRERNLDKGNWKQRYPEKHAEHRRERIFLGGCLRDNLFNFLRCCALRKEVKR